MFGTFGWTRIDRVRNKAVLRRARIERESSSSMEQSIEMVWARGENG